GGSRPAHARAARPEARTAVARHKSAGRRRASAKATAAVAKGRATGRLAQAPAAAARASTKTHRSLIAALPRARTAFCCNRGPYVAVHCKRTVGRAGGGRSYPHPLAQGGQFGRADALDQQQLVHRPEAAVLLAEPDDGLGDGRADAGEGVELLSGGRVEVERDDRDRAGRARATAGASGPGEPGRWRGHLALAG